MKIYMLKSDIDNYKGCFLQDEKIDKSLVKGFNKGVELSVSPEVKFIYDKETKNPAGDICECYDCRGYFISGKCEAVLKNVSKIKAQYIHINDDFILFNNLIVLDKLDKSKTDFKYFENYIMGVNKYCFEDFDYPPVFQVTLPTGFVLRDYFVTEEFVKIIEDNNLNGFLFEEI